MCCRCKQEFPLTTEFFHVAKFLSDGFNSHCKTCRKKSYHLRRSPIQDLKKALTQRFNDLKTRTKKKRVKYDIELEVKQVDEEVSVKKSVELRALTLFQNMDALGNYTNSKWFMDLNKLQLIRMLRELFDIWDYRAPLSMDTKRAICPPIGNPFPNVIYFNQLNITENIDDIRKYILVILEKFVNYGIDRDNKCLGAYYVIGALTLVNPEAATSLPWLYQAFSYMQ
jgi:hypothetical protein